MFCSSGIGNETFTSEVSCLKDIDKRTLLSQVNNPMSIKSPVVSGRFWIDKNQVKPSPKKNSFQTLKEIGFKSGLLTDR